MIEYAIGYNRDQENTCLMLLGMLKYLQLMVRYFNYVGSYCSIEYQGHANKEYGNGTQQYVNCPVFTKPGI